MVWISGNEIGFSLRNCNVLRNFMCSMNSIYRFTINSVNGYWHDTNLYLDITPSEGNYGSKIRLPLFRNHFILARHIFHYVAVSYKIADNITITVASWSNKQAYLIGCFSLWKEPIKTIPTYTYIDM